MIVKIDKSFEKDLSKINLKSIHQKVAECIEQVFKCNRISEVKNIKDLKSNKKCFRIKIGEYRIGVKTENGIVLFIRILHRKEIYKYFP